MTLDLTSAAFRHGGPIPKQHTSDGRNVSPPLKWSAPPAGTRSLALLCEDPEAPRGTFTHWVLFNIPASSLGLKEGVAQQATSPEATRQGTNDFGKVGYGGPAPPPGKPHHYHFKLFALDATLDLEAGATKPQLLEAMKGHILGETQMIGVYGR
jgi:Raf kinase inhibitor-like YbhB/YbcL family protein